MEVCASLSGVGRILREMIILPFRTSSPSISLLSPSNCATSIQELTHNHITDVNRSKKPTPDSSVQ